MKETMLAVAWNGGKYPESMQLLEFPKPVAGPGWVVIENRAAGICGSDLHYLLGTARHLIPDSNLPAVLGHENSGIVVEVGPDVSGLVPGDRVAGEPLHGCLELGRTPCPMCRVGQYQRCPELTLVGVPVKRMLPGGYGQYSAYHHTRLFKVPDNVSDEAASLLDVLAVGVHAVGRAQPRMGDTVVVLGCGVVGLDLIQCLRLQGVLSVIAVAKYGFQAEMARELGASEVIVLERGADAVREVMSLTDGWGADQVYECVGGASDTVQQGIDMCRPGGKVVIVGVFGGQHPVNLQTMVFKEVDLLSSSCYSYTEDGCRREYQVALTLLSAGLVDHESLVTHRFRIDQWEEALDAAINHRENRSLKVQLVHG